MGLKNQECPPQKIDSPDKLNLISPVHAFWALKQQELRRAATKII